MTDQSPPLLQGQHLSVTVGPKPIVREVSIELHQGEILGLIGPNGAGKSTLLKTLAGLQEHTGRVRWQGRDMHSFTAGERALNLAYLAQSAMAHWPVSVQRLIELGRIPHLPWWQRPGEPDRQAVERAITLAEVEHLRRQPVSTLSGGERMRVMLARVFAADPSVILADEPCNALDPYHQLHIMELLQAHARRRGGVVVVLHDLTLAARFCDRLVLMSNGEMIGSGTAREVLAPGKLEQVYGIRAQYWQQDGDLAVVPWQRAKHHS